MARNSTKDDPATTVLPPGKILEQVNAPLTISQRAIAAAKQSTDIVINGIRYKVKTAVTLPVLKQDKNDVAFTVIEPMYTGREIKGRDGKKNMEPATLVKVVDLADNIEKLYVVNAVLKSEWTENPNYADNKYIGKSFAVRKLPVAEGKRHRDLRILELEDVLPGDTVNVSQTSSLQDVEMEVEE